MLPRSQSGRESHVHCHCRDHGSDIKRRRRLRVEGGGQSFRQQHVFVFLVEKRVVRMVKAVDKLKT